MLLLFSLLLFFFSIFSYLKFKTYLAPSFLISFIWGIIILGYYIIPHGMYAISNKTITVLLLWIFLSYVSSYFFSCIKLKERAYLQGAFNVTIRNIYYYISIFCFFPLIYIAYKQGTTLGEGSFLFNLRMANTGIIESEYKYGIFQYGFAFATVSFLIEFYTLGWKNKKVIILLIINLLLALITMAKSSFFFLIISIYVINAFKYNYSWRKLIPASLFILFFMIILQVMRAGNETENVISTMFNVYIFGGIPALNEVVNANTHSVHFGSFTLRFFYIILGISPDQQLINDVSTKGYMFIPYPTNVYTVIFPYWVDFGFLGVIVGAILNGSFVGFIYKCAIKKRLWAITLYAFLAAVLVLPFFGEYLVTNLSYTIQLIFLFYFANKFSYRFTFKLKKNDY